MARPATGSPRWNAKESRWEARITLAGAGRRVVPMPGIAEHDVERARRVARLISDKARASGAVPAETGETANEWYGRYHLYQVELGQTDAGKKRDRWRKWIAPKIGTKPMAAVTRDDVEDIRDALDAAIVAWKASGGISGGKRGAAIAGKTAMNVWSCLTSSFKAATSSKRRDLRVLEGKANPCVGVEPPGDQSSRRVRRKTFLYPKEAAALFASAVPLQWREVYALACMMYLRPGELRVLTWADVDAANGHVKVTKAWDYADGKIKPPKTSNGVRQVPIEPALAPLLERMRKGKEVDRARRAVPLGLR